MSSAVHPAWWRRFRLLQAGVVTAHRLRGILSCAPDHADWRARNGLELRFLTKLVISVAVWYFYLDQQLKTKLSFSRLPKCEVLRGSTWVKEAIY